MAKITANNIFTGAITSDKLDSSVASSLATANNANVVATIASTVAAAAFSTANNLSSILANSAPIITSITITDSSYTPLDDTAANTTGGFCIITGSGFVSTPTVVFGTTSAPAVSFINATTLRVQIPALTAASYPVYVVNSNGGTAIRVNGLTTSSFPAWSTGATLSNQNANTSFSVALSANSDSNITYANTTALPAGTTLAANGLFSGTVTIGTQTTYTFDVKATDAELQDATRTFSLTITISAPKLYGWGRAVYGTTSTLSTDASSPTQVGTSTDWGGDISIGGQRHQLAIKTNGTLWAWGRNVFGALGINDTIDRSSPTQVGAGTTWLRVSAQRYFSFATKTDGTLWAWGANFTGNLGLNLATGGYRSSPTQVGTNTNWSLIESAGRYTTVAIKTDGTLWSWGQGESGQLGLNIRGTSAYRSSPTQIGTETDWSNLHSNAQTADFARSFVIKSNGTLWAWGKNALGALGINDTIDRSSPTQVGTSTNWASIAIGDRHSIATKTDGTLWAWGQNDWYQLGVLDNTYRSSPVQIGTGTNWSTDRDKIACVLKGCFAIKTNGTLWSWGGTGNYGVLGQNNDVAALSSPVQIGSSTNWIKVIGPNYNNSSVGVGEAVAAVNNG